MSKETALINGTAHSWSDITVNILGVPVAGIDAIKYSDDQEIEDNYGAGRLPVSRGYGEIKTKGSITLHMEEVVALQQTVPSHRLQDIPPFDIPVSYLPSSGNVTTDLLRNCQFKGNGRDPKRGDKKIAVDIELAISHIEWGV
jgi:hypothetical protein